MTNREEVLIKKLDALRGEIRKGRRDIEISKSAITKMENELWCTSQELYLERAVRESKKHKECDYFYGQDDICLVNELLKNGIIRGIKI